MQPGLYVALSGQIALERRLTTIAHNVANAGTVGFRAEGVHFASLVSGVSHFPTSFSATGGDYLSTASGGLAQTGNPLDVAIQGNGWIAIATPAGVAYTRDGRMRMTDEGSLVTLAGHAVLDAGNAPLTVDPAAGPAAIGRDGMITQNGRQIGAIGLFAIETAAGYRRFENSAVIPSTPATPVLSFAADGFVQGFVEDSNVNPVTEMTHLIFVTRAFESLAAAIDDSSNALRGAIQTLGSRT